MNKTKRSVNKYKNQQIASYWNFKFKDAMVAKAPYTKKWQDYIDAYNGNYFNNTSLPEYKSNMVSNYVFSVIETIRPIMLDNNPKFQAMPRQPEGLQFSNDLHEALMYEWDREDMMAKLCRELLITLIIGTGIFFIFWDRQEKKIKCIPVSAFNIFPDPLATNVDDAEYIIYANYFNVELLKRNFPQCSEDLSGGTINYSELVNNNDKNSRVSNQVFILEIHTKDLERKEYTDEEPLKKGRVLTIAPELGLVLEEKENPYQDGKLPFELIKDYDVSGKFWGEGEVVQLLSPQKYINEFNNTVIDSAKTTANSPWIIDKNSGIGHGKITSRPGLILRKNPGTEVRREQPPNMPNYVINAIETWKGDIEQISGIFNTVKGGSETGVYTAQGILALQEAGQARIRLKVKLLELSLGRIAQKWFSRMRQFWTDNQWITITQADGSYDMKMFTSESLKYDYDIKITAGSTMPSNKSAMLDLMVRLAQTPMPDGQPLVDREAVTQYLPDEVRITLLQRMGEGQQQIEMQVQQLMEGLQQLQQGLEQFMQEDEQEDKQVLDVIDEITKAVENLEQQIVQLTDKHVKLEQEKVQEEKINKAKTEAYNNGYTDSEKLYSSSTTSGEGLGEDVFSKGDVEGGLEEGLPDDVLQGIEEMSDDELALLIESNPELLEIFE